MIFGGSSLPAQPPRRAAGAFAAARALLLHPEFYTVAVAVSGNHDNAVNLAMWAEHFFDAAQFAPGAD